MISDKRKVFVSYLDDSDKKVSGYFDQVMETESGTLIIHSGTNRIRVPTGRWKKTKEELR